MPLTGALILARILYLNTDPFFAGWDERAFPVTSATPRELGRLAEAGKIDAGPIPLVDYWRLERDVEPLENLGIAMNGEAKSVLLFLKRPIAAQPDGFRLGVTDQSSTSVQLTKILLQHRHKKTARLAPFSPEDDARLLIGDDALLAKARGLDGFPVIVDLGLEWNQWQKLPFVFSRWVVRKSLAAAAKEDIASRLRASLARFRADPNPVAHDAAKRLGLPLDDIRRYLAAFRYELGPEEEKGEAAFRALI